MWKKYYLPSRPGTLNESWSKKGVGKTITFVNEIQQEKMQKRPYCE